MARASDAFARAAAPDRFSRADPDRGRRQTAALAGSAAYTARLVARATGAGSATGWIAVFKQLQRVGRAIEQQRRSAGQLATADALQHAVKDAVRAFEDATASTPTTTADRLRSTHKDTGRDRSTGRDGLDR